MRDIRSRSVVGFPCLSDRNGIQVFIVVNCDDPAERIRDGAQQTVFIVSDRDEVAVPVFDLSCAICSGFPIVFHLCAVGSGHGNADVLDRIVRGSSPRWFSAGYNSIRLSRKCRTLRAAA